MAFKLIQNPTFRTVCDVQVPTDDGVVAQSLSVRFKVMKPEDNELDIDSFLTSAILSVDDVIDDAGQPLPSTPSLIKELVSLPFMRLALTRAYWAALSQAKAGN